MQFETITFDLPGTWKRSLRELAKHRKLEQGSCSVSDLCRDAIRQVYIEKGGDNGDSSDREGNEESSRKFA